MCELQLTDHQVTWRMSFRTHGLMATRSSFRTTPQSKPPARRMDIEEASEPGWCEAHLDEIVGWLREEAEKRKLPFLDIAGRVLVRRAIRNSLNKEQQ